MASYLGQNGIPRGIRNNNPGNIKRGSSAWKGKVPFSQSTDNTFEQFKTVEYGIRAMFVLLYNYYNKNGLKTISKIIGKWAPAGTDNNHTNNYINYVVKNVPQVNTAHDVININDKYTMCEMALAMSKFENGEKAVDDYLTSKHFEDAYLLFKNGNTTITETASGISTPQSSKIGSLLTIVALAVLTVIAIKY